MNYKGCIATFVFAFLIINCCQSQNMIKRNVPEHQIWRNGILPKIKAKIDSLYPNATNVHVGDRSRVSDSSQGVFITCNCPEGSGMYITFDTNGNIMNKDISISIKDLPDIIANHIKRDTAKNVKYGDRAIKSLPNKGEITYSIFKSYAHDGPTNGTWIYTLKFKNSGEFISEEKRFQNI